ncbi:MAG TPA: right-handed parallel beta-helix repeat-containing protein, partial [Gemmatimonadales bacterium]|nr:right-handed parallel beta-helix repeat-containing protein [Gemmatimonadales bacterium]
LVYGTEIDHANTAMFGPGTGDHKAGGLKISHSVGATIRKVNVHDNPIGLWCDISCANMTIDSSTIANNSRRGVQYEISYGCRIANNVVTGNGRGEGGSSGAGVWIAQSTDCKVVDNEFRDNNVAVMGTDRDRGTGTQGVYQLTGLLVTGNRIRQMSGTAGGIQDQSSARNPYAAGANNRYTGNRYECGTGTRWHWENTPVGRSTWLQEGNDSGASFAGC